MAIFTIFNQKSIWNILQAAFSFTILQLFMYLPQQGSFFVSLIPMHNLYVFQTLTFSGLSLSLSFSFSLFLCVCVSVCTCVHACLCAFVHVTHRLSALYFEAYYPVTLILNKVWDPSQVLQLEHRGALTLGQRVTRAWHQQNQSQGKVAVTIAILPRLLEVIIHRNAMHPTQANLFYFLKTAVFNLESLAR